MVHIFRRNKRRTDSFLCRDIEYFSFSVKYEVQHNLAIRISISVMQHLQVKSFVGVKQGNCEVTQPAL